LRGLVLGVLWISVLCSCRHRQLISRPYQSQLSRRSGKTRLQNGMIILALHGSSAFKCRTPFSNSCWCAWT
jgi:hypothetical protein